MYKNFSGFKEFIKAAFRDPRNVSTIFPTLRFLGQALVDEAQLKPSDRVLELGCGSGAITRQILANKHNFGEFTGVEIDPHLVDYLKGAFPGENFIAASAADLKEHIPDESIDAVICSLPWTIFAGDLQESIVDEILRVLKPEGRLSTFMCIHTMSFPGSARAKEIFAAKFASFEKKRSIAANLPPANVYLCRK